MSWEDDHMISWRQDHELGRIRMDREDLDERIALLLRLYRDRQGPAGIEYHLTRRLAQRD